MPGTRSPSGVRVSVCVAVWKERPGPPNLASLAAQLEGALDEPAELVVVLNGIEPGPAGAPPWATTVQFPCNRGVVHAWNAAARAAAGQILVFANDDLDLGADSLSQLTRALSELPQAGVVGVEPLLAGSGDDRAVAGARGAATSCAAVVGYLFAVSRDVLEEAGGFDPAFTPCLWEEADFCAAVRKLGLRVYAVPGVACRHAPGISGRRAWPWTRIRYCGRSESLRSIRMRNLRRYKAKWGV